MAPADDPLHDLPSRMELSRLPLHVSDAQLGEFASLVALWRRKRGPDWLPARAAFGPRDFLPRWLGWIVIDQVIWEPFDLYCRLFGQRVVELYGQDQTGRYLSSYCEHPTEGDAWRRYLDFVADTLAEPCFVQLRELFSRQDRFVAATWLGMPLSADGGRVTHVLSGVVSHIGGDR